MKNYSGGGLSVLLTSLWISLCRCLSDMFVNVWKYLRKFLFCILSFGPMPNHISFIMDGNRRFAHRLSLKLDAGHENGFLALMSILQYCYEMGVKYVTVYAFSIDNFKRTPDEVQSIMDLMQAKIEELLKQEGIVTKYKVKMNFWGNLRLLSEPVRLAAEKAMTATAHNTGPVLSVCVAYTSSDEIVRALQDSCQQKWDVMRKKDWNFSEGSDDDAWSREDNGEDLISVADMERHLYTAGYPDPEILIRTSGETRLSNFLLWQTTFCHLQNPHVLWPEFSIWNLVWAILKYQRAHPYLEMGRSDGTHQRCLGSLW